MMKMITNRSFFDKHMYIFLASEGKRQVFDIDIEAALGVEVGEESWWGGIMGILKAFRGQTWEYECDKICVQMGLVMAWWRKVMWSWVGGLE